MQKIHTQKDKAWTNADGQSIPYKYVSEGDKVKETIAGKIVKDALKIETALAAFYTLISEGFKVVYLKMLDDYKTKYNKDRKIKGNYSFYTFDGGIRISASIQDAVKWDDYKMTEAREELNTYLSQNLGDTATLIKELVMSAFSNRKGLIDTAKVFQLLKYESKIKNKHYQRACALMRDAHSITNSKQYMQVAIRQEDGSYRNVNLNFSSL